MMTMHVNRFFSRCFQLILVLIPAIEGIFALLNDIYDRDDTLHHVIIPLLSMNNVHDKFMHSWRAIVEPHLQYLCYNMMFLLEGLVGVLAIIGFIKMLINFNGDHRAFVRAQTLARAACCLGVAVWGVGFFVIAGDFFLAWQNPDVAYLQAGGLNYALMMFVAYMLMKIYAQSSEV